MCINNSHIPQRDLRIIMDVIEARNKEIVEKWYGYFKEISFYC